MLKKVTVFFGIMVGDMFDSTEEMDNIDEALSILQYAKLCEAEIICRFAKHDEIATVEWEAQNVGGSVPFGLRTKVNGVADHDDIEFVNNIFGEVWQEFEWLVEIS